MSTPHTLIAAEIDRLTAIAKAAYVGPWKRPWPSCGDVIAPGPVEVCVTERVEDGDAIAAFASPDVVLCGLAEDRDILKRHQIFENLALSYNSWYCTECCENLSGPHCAEIRSLARRRGISIEEQQ